MEAGRLTSRRHPAKRPDLAVGIAAQIGLGPLQIKGEAKRTVTPAGDGVDTDRQALHPGGGTILGSSQKATRSEPHPLRAKAAIGPQLQGTAHDLSHLTFQPGPPVVVEAAQKQIRALPAHQKNGHQGHQPQKDQPPHTSHQRAQEEGRELGQAFDQAMARGPLGLRQLIHLPG
jgi:hypothetical protein